MERPVNCLDHSAENLAEWAYAIWRINGKPKMQNIEVPFKVSCVVEGSFDGKKYLIVEGTAVVDGQKRNHAFSIYPESSLAKLERPRDEQALSLQYGMYMSKGKLNFGLQSFKVVNPGPNPLAK